MMEAARTSEKLENFNQTTWRYNPEDSHLYSINFCSFYDDESFLRKTRFLENMR
jgi:hypothetical protein